MYFTSRHSYRGDQAEQGNGRGHEEERGPVVDFSIEQNLHSASEDRKKESYNCGLI